MVGDQYLSTGQLLKDSDYLSFEYQRYDLGGRKATIIETNGSRDWFKEGQTLDVPR